MKNIIVAVDFSDITLNLVDKAIEMADYYKAHVYIIHVASPNPEFVGYNVGPNYVRQSLVDELKGEKKQLEILADRVKDKGIKAIPLLIQGSTAKHILMQVERLNSELLIIGTHGYGLALSTLLGSTSSQVIKQVKCPVLLIPN